MEDSPISPVAGPVALSFGAIFFLWLTHRGSQILAVGLCPHLTELVPIEPAQLDDSMFHHGFGYAAKQVSAAPIFSRLFSV